MAESPLRNDGVTIACPVCGHQFRRRGRGRFCSSACRQAAWRQRHPAVRAPLLPLPPRVPRGTTVYQCSACDARYVGQQWCPDCQRFCRRLGPGGPCPHCDEPVALGDLLPATLLVRPEKGGPSLSH